MAIQGFATAARGEGTKSVKVEGPKSTSSTGQVRRTRSTGASGASGEFSAELDRVTGTEDEAPAPVEGTGGVVGIGGILAAQSVSDEETGPQERRRRAKRGIELLERLEDIRRGLLRGAIPKDRLTELVRLMREKRERGADPVIAGLMDEIELRAAVELAKLGLPVA